MDLPVSGTDVAKIPRSETLVCTEYKKNKSNWPVSAVLDKQIGLVTYNNEHNYGTVQ